MKFTNESQFETIETSNIDAACSDDDCIEEMVIPGSSITSKVSLIVRFH